MPAEQCWIPGPTFFSKLERQESEGRKRMRRLVGSPQPSSHRTGPSLRLQSPRSQSPWKIPTRSDSVPRTLHTDTEQSNATRVVKVRRPLCSTTIRRWGDPTFEAPRQTNKGDHGCLLSTGTQRHVARRARVLSHDTLLVQHLKTFA